MPRSGFKKGLWAHWHSLPLPPASDADRIYLSHYRNLRSSPPSGIHVGQFLFFKTKIDTLLSRISRGNPSIRPYSKCLPIASI